MSPLEATISLLTPLECFICNKEGDMLCVECVHKTYSTQESRCYLCNKITKQQQVCQGCRSKSYIRRVWWLENYKGITKEIIKEMKFHRKRSYARGFGCILADHLPYLPEETVVVHVPTASTRIRRRGFDQAALIARQFAAKRQLRYLPLLCRLRQDDQIGKSRNARYEQMQQSFSIHTDRLPKKASILLIDDVTTTGATLEAAAKVLRRHGAAHVDACVIARHLLQ